jgi:hypothetical protein
MSGAISFQFGMPLGLALLAACADNPDVSSVGRIDRREVEQTFKNDGVVCLSPQGEAVAVEVVFNRCLSSSCDEARAAACTVELDEDRIVVSSQLMVTSETGPQVDCTADCGQAQVSCGRIQLGTSSIRVIHGSDESEVLGLPLAGPTQVFEWSLSCSDTPTRYFGE